jgi:hypothetical protein
MRVRGIGVRRSDVVAGAALRAGRLAKSPIRVRAPTSAGEGAVRKGRRRVPGHLHDLYHEPDAGRKGRSAREVVCVDCLAQQRCRLFTQFARRSWVSGRAGNGEAGQRTHVVGASGTPRARAEDSVAGALARRRLPRALPRLRRSDRPRRRPAAGRRRRGSRGLRAGTPRVALGASSEHLVEGGEEAVVLLARAVGHPQPALLAKGRARPHDHAPLREAADDLGLVALPQRHP